MHLMQDGHDETPPRPSRSGRVLAVGGAVVALALLWHWGIRVHRGGADYDHYIRYARRMRAGDLWFSGPDLSPTGVIVCHHSIGPGLTWLPFMAAGAALGAEGTDRTFAFVSHFLQGAALVALMIAVMRRAGASPFQSVAALTFAAFGTPLFYYWVLAISSELLGALTLFGLFAFLYLRARDEGRGSFYVYAGLLAGAAVVARANSALAVGPVLLLLAYRACRQRPWRDAAARVAALCATCVLALAPSLITNWLFTGSPLSSPFTQRLPSGRWVWFEWATLHAGAVLFSHWHGWIAYSPIVLLAVGALAWHTRDQVCAWRRDPALGRNLSVWLPWVFGVGFAGQVLLFAAYRCWWMGWNTFGGRQFVPVAPFVAVAVAWLFKRLRCASLWSWPVLLALGLSLWTYALHFDRFGASNFTRSYGEFFAAQGQTLWALAQQPVFVVPFAILMLLSVAARGRDALQWLTPLGLALLMAGCLMPYYARLRGAPAPASDRTIALVLAAGGLAAAWALARMARRHPRPAVWLCVALVAAVDLFVFACAARTKAIAQRAAPKHEFVAAFEAKEWIETFEEYGRIDGDEDAKRSYAAAIREFARTQARQAPRP